jgi:hypothetical protein
MAASINSVALRQAQPNHAGDGVLHIKGQYRDAAGAADERQIGMERHGAPWSAMALDRGGRHQPPALLP